MAMLSCGILSNRQCMMCHQLEYYLLCSMPRGRLPRPSAIPGFGGQQALTVVGGRVQMFNPMANMMAQAQAAAAAAQFNPMQPMLDPAMCGMGHMMPMGAGAGGMPMLASTGMPMNASSMQGLLGMQQPEFMQQQHHMLGMMHQSTKRAASASSSDSTHWCKQG